MEISIRIGLGLRFGKDYYDKGLDDRFRISI